MLPKTTLVMALVMTVMTDNTWLLIELTPKGAVFISFFFLQHVTVRCHLLTGSLTALVAGLPV